MILCMIFSIAFPDPHYIKRTLKTYHVLSKAFLYLNENVFIQNHQMPIIYHIPRHKSNKHIIV